MLGNQHTYSRWRKLLRGLRQHQVAFVVMGSSAILKKVEQKVRFTGTSTHTCQQRVFFVPKFVCKFGDKKYPNFKNQREFTKKFQKCQKSLNRNYTSFGTKNTQKLCWIINTLIYVSTGSILKMGKFSPRIR